jgi:hypothetical protein
MCTPTTPEGESQYDHLPPELAAYRAWVDEGPDPGWHRRMQALVRVAMPLLARALDREVRELRDGRT